MRKMTIKAEKREVSGKNAARRIRREGRLPAILYGSESENVPLILNKKDIFSILKSETGGNTIFKVIYDQLPQEVMIKDYHHDTVSDEILHVDLIRIAMDKEIRVNVPVELVGTAVGVKAEGGFVDFVTREIEIECLPGAIPESFEADISELHLNQSLKVEELLSVEGVRCITDPQTVVVHIEVPAVEEEVAEAEEEEEQIMAEEEEPEVIKKEKAEGAEDTDKE
jgi:large subunit ribosomal protein L25